MAGGGERGVSLLVLIHLIQSVVNDQDAGKLFRHREEHAREIVRRGVLGFSHLRSFFNVLGALPAGSVIRAA